MVKKRSTVLEHPGQESFELAHFAGAEAAQQVIEDLRRTGAQFRNGKPPLLGQFEIDQTPIILGATSTDQALGFEPIHHARHRAAIIGNVLTQLRR